MADAVLTQVEIELAARVAAWPALSDYEVVTDQPLKVALEDDQRKAIVIRCVGYELDVANEQGQTRHSALFEFEIITGGPAMIIGREAHTVAAHIIGCIAQDRTLDGMIEDFQERDLAPTDANGKDVGSVSLQANTIFYTSQDDWFTLVST